jgi:aryl-alcohol dehydrogenase-like predicted oxidoreductase
MGHVAIAWLLTRPAVASVLLGARSVDQLRDNLAAAAIDLTAQDVADLTRASSAGLPPCPYGMIEEFGDIPQWKQLGTASA